MASRATELRVVSAAFVVAAIVFVLFPGIDLWTSGLFYRGEQGWVFANGNWPVFEWLYRGTPRAGQALLIALLLGLLGGLSKRLPWLHRRRTLFGFILAAALLGPILMVDATLKDYWGRARPGTVQEFGGSQRFTPAFVISDQCPKNCSFVSGHVATASFIMAFGWLGAPALRRRWLWASMAAGSLLAIVRLTAGGHFLSDTVLAWFVTYYSLWLTEWGFRRLGWLPPATPASAALS